MCEGCGGDCVASATYPYMPVEILLTILAIVIVAIALGVIVDLLCRRKVRKDAEKRKRR